MFQGNQNQYVSMAEGFMSKVYGWMCIGLGLTAGVSYYLAMNPLMMASVIKMLLPLMLVQLGIVFYFSFKWQTLSFTTLTALFTVYSSLNGAMLAPIFARYQLPSIFYVFVITSGMFLSMALYGWFTKSDLSSMGNILLMGLFGLILSGLVNIFVQSHAFSMLHAVIGVGIFSMLTAYDIQKLKTLSQQSVASPELANKLVLVGALSLYLDFVNLFIYLLRLFGQPRD